MSEGVLAFRVTEYDQGFHSMVRYDGLLRLDGEVLVLELREQRTDLSTFVGRKSSTIERTIPIEQIERAELHRRFFGGGLLELHTRSLSVLDGVPSSTGNVLRVRLSRAAMDDARSLVAGVNDVLADRVLRRLDEPNDGPAGA
jgi:hypothetical protein